MIPKSGDHQKVGLSTELIFGVSLFEGVSEVLCVSRFINRSR